MEGILALSCMKSHIQSLKAGHTCSLTQKPLAGLSPALSLKPIKYICAVDSTIPATHVIVHIIIISHNDIFTPVIAMIMFTIGMLLALAYIIYVSIVHSLLLFLVFLVWITL